MRVVCRCTVGGDTVGGLMNRKNAVFAAILVFFTAIPLFSAESRYDVPDSSDIRKGMRETWFEAPLSAVRQNHVELRKNNIGKQFQIRLEETDELSNIFVAPQYQLAMDVYADGVQSTVMQDYFPGDGIGSWLLMRDKKTGKPLSIRYYFAADSEIFVQFTPAGKTAYADFIVYKCYAARGVPTGLPFARFYDASFNEIVKWTADMLPWQYAKSAADSYHSSQQMINFIREKIPSIRWTDDAMYDENENPVNISDGKPREITPEEQNKLVLSGAGFLKWIADGVIEPLTGGRLKRDPLLKHTVKYKDTGFQGIMASKYDISFSLDWIRNLAAAIFSVRTGRQYLYNESGVDVKIEPFAAELTDNGIQNISGFIKNTGYSVKQLKPMLYVLAVTEPETFYFAAIRETDRRTPEVKVFNECAVIFPYFDARGRFQCTIFKDGREIPLDRFYSRYYRDYIFLTRARCTEKFFPQ